MLDVFRANKGGILSWIFLGAIIASFVIYFGPGKFSQGQGGCTGGGPASYAAHVDGKPIPATQLRLVLEQQEEYLRQRAPERYEELMPILAQNAMSELVTHAVLAREAERRGIRVSDEDVKNAQYDRPEFQEDGKFVRERFKEFVTRRWGSVDAYFEMENDNLAVDRLETAFDATVHVPESEIHDMWKMQMDTVDVAYVLFPIADARAEVKPSDAEVQAFANKEAARIQKFYADNAARYDQPKKIRARHILAKIQGNDSDAAKKRIEAAIARIDKGEDFAKVAAEVSDDDSTKAGGGDLGVITAGQVDAAFEKAAMALEAGKLSGPVQTPAGWHVIRVDQVIPAKKMELAEVRSDIARELLVEDRAQALVKQKAEAALQAAKGGKSLTELFPTPRPAIPATEKTPATPEVKASLTLGGKPVAARETNAFPASMSEVPGAPGSGALLKDALAAESKTVLPRVYDTPNGTIVAVVRNRVRPDEKLYPVQRHAIEIGLHGEKSRELEYAWRTQLAKRSKIDQNEELLRRLTGGKAAPAPAED
jgi:peptidyl-prolyl cis-trans isomerase D